MAATALPLAAGESLLGSDLLVPLGGLAALMAMLGMALLLPLYVTQRREVHRLLEWQEQHPEAGDDGSPDEPAGATAVFPGRRGDGPMTPAERVTSERPALARIGTAERAALELEKAPFWRRVVERGPRHPLVISLLALVIAAAIFFAASLLIHASDDDAPTGKDIDPTSISVVVLNASPFPGLAANVAEDVAAARFVVAGTNAATDTVNESVVRFADGFQKEARAVARKLNITKVEPFNSESEAAAEGAPVVVVVGEDLAKGEGNLSGESNGGNGKK
jgi:hypothetical protein